MQKIALMALVTGLVGLSAQAEIVKAAPDHYTLRHEAVSPLDKDDLWDRLIAVESWWHPDHSYSGDAANLSLDPAAGGLWLEDWDGGSVAHGTVLYIKTGEQLRLNAPFGPLQELGVTVVWTITLEATEDGTKVIFDEVANGTAASKLDELAPAVDYVKAEAISRLTARPYSAN